MSISTSHAPFDPRDLISERAARRISAHPRSDRKPARAAVSAAATDPPRSAGGAQILRRWSVAELIAAAAWRPAAI